MAACLPPVPFRARSALQLPAGRADGGTGLALRARTALLTHAPTAGSPYCNPDFLSFFFFFSFSPLPFYGLAEKTLHRHQRVQSAACRILTPSQGLSGCRCPSGGSRAGSLSNITSILKLL